ncbi:MAG: hypothetical protein K0R54_392 [Clostridiaceae bacterium]|jgi:hypothetical protein|nr:hypothetical protein [Clostridiaceae bacterium]
MSNNVKLNGIITEEEINKINFTDYCKEICETDKLIIPDNKAFIANLLELSIYLELNSFKVISTKNGDNILVNGNKIITIKYSSKIDPEKIYIEEFKIPFCNFIFLEDCSRKVSQVIGGVEYCNVNCSGYKSIYVSSLIFICAQFNENEDENFSNENSGYYDDFEST